MRALVLLILLAVACTVIAQTKIYKIVNEDGTVSFSDTPAPGAEELEITTSANTIQSAPINPVPNLNSQSNQDEVKYTLSITSPEPEATIRDNNGRLSISARIQPELAGQYVLNFGGKQYSSTTGVFNLQDVNRGAYSYNVKFTDNSGKLIASSEDRNLYMHQASVLIRNAVN